MAHKKQMKQDIYLEQKVFSASPEQLISFIYDAAIAGCVKRDFQKTSSALNVLINSLNFDGNEELKEMCSRFYQTYDHMFNLLRKKKYDEVHCHLKEIRHTWSKAMKVY